MSTEVSRPPCWPGRYCELSIGFARIEELEAVITEASLAMQEIPREALFLAAKVFLRYRRSRGAKSNVLPDFHIGAHDRGEPATQRPRTHLTAAS